MDVRHNNSSLFGMHKKCWSGAQTRFAAVVVATIVMAPLFPRRYEKKTTGPKRTEKIHA
jgi:hypothetical protein